MKIGWMEKEAGGGHSGSRKHAGGKLLFVSGRGVFFPSGSYHVYVTNGQVGARLMALAG